MNPGNVDNAIRLVGLVGISENAWRLSVDLGKMENFCKIKKL